MQHLGFGQFDGKFRQQEGHAQVGDRSFVIDNLGRWNLLVLLSWLERAVVGDRWKVPSHWRLRPKCDQPRFTNKRKAVEA